jgi:nucleotide-binding universal stress UspA family protein
MIENILFPVDFSPSCVGMAAYVKRVAALFSSRVTMLHVCDLASHNGFELYLRTLQEIADEHLSVARHKLHSFLEGDFPPAKCERWLRFGDPAADIVEFARTGKFDLIVMPTHAGHFRRMLLGSTTAKVLDDADCPVMTTEHADITVPKPLGHRRWICGIGHGSDAARVLRLATRAAVEARANLSVIHVCDECSRGTSQCWLDSIKCQNMLEDFGGQTVRILEGHVKQALLEATQHPLADALIIGRSAKHGLIGRMRDLTYSLIRDSPVPVLSV